MILILAWSIAVLIVLCCYAAAVVVRVVVRWIEDRPPKNCGVAFDVARLGTNVRVRPVRRPSKAGGAAVSESKRLERLLKAREYVAGLDYFADR